MKEFENAFISSDAGKKAKYLVDSYKRLGVYIKVIPSPHSDVLFVQVEQKKYINDKILNAAELIERGRDVFKGKINEGVRLYISPIFSNSDELKGVNADYVKGKLQQLGLKQSQLEKGLDLDKATLSSLLAGRKDFTKPLRAAFYYYFKSMNLKEAVS